MVPRLWASRKIGVLVDAVRQMGADNYSAADQATLAKDPKLKELVDEIVRLSQKFGVLTEYTAFLAYEGTDIYNRDNVLATCNGNLMERGVGVRTGWAAVNQSANGIAMQNQSCLNLSNSFLDADLNSVMVSNVLQVCDLTFYSRKGQWVDSRVEGNPTEPRVVAFGSDEYYSLLERLVSKGRESTLSLSGDILLKIDGETILVRGQALPGEKEVGEFDIYDLPGLLVSPFDVPTGTNPLSANDLLVNPGSSTSNSIPAVPAPTTGNNPATVPATPPGG